MILPVKTMTFQTYFLPTTLSTILYRCLTNLRDFQNSFSYVNAHQF